MNEDTEKAFQVNQFRKTLRHVKNVVLRNKNKDRSIYELTDKEENVKPETIVFESFGGKNYSDSPKYIYEYMQKYYPNYRYVWSFKNPKTMLFQVMQKQLNEIQRHIIKRILKQVIGFQMRDYHYI